MATKAVFALAAAAVLAGCATPYAPAPLATNFPTSKQPKLQAAAHWDLIAKSMSQQLIAELKKAPQRPVHIPDVPAEATPFQRALQAQLISALVNQGQVVSRSPAGALRVDIDVQALTFSPGRPQARFAGLPTSIGTGVWLLSDNLGGMDWGFAVAAAGAGVDAYRWYTSEYADGQTPRTELIITASVTDQYRYYARSTAAYYVADSDRALYGADQSKDSQSKLIKVRGDR
jgi:hypothetical protein